MGPIPDRADARPRETVVLIHGLWMHGLVMRVLGHHLARAGYRPRYFSYPTVSRNLRQNAQSLWQFVEKIDEDRVHFVAHSLAGLLLRHYFSLGVSRQSGRVVMLGSPNQGSYVAGQLNRFALGRILMGKSVEQGLLGGAPPWPAEVPLGVVAGKVPLGAGRIVPGLPKPHDGTVGVAETRLAGMADHAVLPVSHTSMLFSRHVAIYIVSFLQTGHFPPSTPVVG